MSDYEPAIVEITSFGDSHQLFYVCDYTGRTWQARGARLMSEKDWVISQEIKRRRAVCSRFERRANRLAKSKRFWWMRNLIFARAKDIVSNYNSRKRSQSIEEWYLANFHKHRNPMLDLPPLPSWDEISKPR